MRGKVYLVGAGPGDPGLITVRGLSLLREADVIVYDRLVDRRLLREARPEADLIDVGKGRGQRRLSQEEVNALLIQRAREGRMVVRLKGGDPFLFGRGGEEAEALARAGVPFEVVPGVTSALAVPAYAGIPVTHRGLSSSVAIVTGSEDPAKGEARVDWSALSRADTLVVLMGREALFSITRALLEAGRPPATPVAVVRWGTEPYQRTVEGTLGDIVEKVEREGLEPPVVVVVGEVVRLRGALAWFERKPLFGRRVLVTRARHQAPVLSALLAQEGAWPVELPALEVVPEDPGPLDRALVRLFSGSYRWLIFTSANGVALFFEGLARQGKDARALGPVQVCALGPGTAAALRERGVVPDLVPEEFIAEGVVSALRPRLRPGERVLVARAVGGREALGEGLRTLGVEVEEVPLYRVVPPEGLAERACEALREGVDVVTFTSSSAVRHLVEALGEERGLLEGPLVACLGPVTAGTAREMGVRVDLVAPEYSMVGLVRALASHFTGPGGG